MRTLLTLVLALSACGLFAQAPAQKPAPKAAPAPVTAAFVGNKDSKIFHKADCKLAGKMKPENKVSFATKEEAGKAGYKPCKVCLK